MIEYIKLYNEFDGFLRSLTAHTLSSYEKKLINIIKKHFDDIAKCGKAKGKRADLLNKLIQIENPTISTDLDIAINETKKTVYPFEKLTRIEAEHFRGFSDKENLKLNKRLVFVYGPNGSGKSSLCEALEYKLLEYINEAISKRIPIEKYIKNAITNGTPLISLYGMKDGKEMQIAPNQSLCHFFFIEKDRIDNFARISAHTHQEKNNLLSSLFGLDEFNNFITEFTDNIGDTIDTVGKNKKELEQKSLSIKAHQENIEKSREKLIEIESSKSEIIKELFTDKSFSEFEAFIIERTAAIENELIKPLETENKIILTEEIDKLLLDFNGSLQVYNKLIKDYESKKSKVIFRDLYAAVSQLESVSPNKCPACETPITATVKNPYSNAREKLDELQEISNLEHKIETEVANLKTRGRLFCQNIQSRYNSIKSINLPVAIDLTLEVPNDLQSDINDYISSVNNIIASFSKAKGKHISIDSEIRTLNKVIKDKKLERDRLSEEKQKLSKLAENVKEIKGKENNCNEIIKDAKKSIADFNKENEKLIREVEEEKNQVLINKGYVEAYNSFLIKLKEYKARLPIQHLAQLNDLTLNFYNIINTHDKLYENLSKIELPSKPDDPIFICFSNELNKHYDALHILSEGHIRCLGLSILLAKNVHLGCPVLILDDIVNAIDDDHRGGIRKLLLESDKFVNKQIILTTHAELFISDIENDICAKEYGNLVEKYIFLPGENERKVFIKTNDTSNYLLKANQYLTLAKKKDSLKYCRCCLENLINKIWKKLGKKYNTLFSVKLREPNGKPDLMPLVNSINTFIKENTIAEYMPITDAFNFLTGLEKQNKAAWNYMNSGTHEGEDRDDFDEIIVKNIIHNLTDIDNHLKSKK